MDQPIYAVVMAGGRGERFWPKSRNARPKQLLKLTGELTMIEDTVARVREVTDAERILVITNREYVEAIRSLLPELPAGNIIGEPAGRDTGPCAALAAALVCERGGEEAVMLLLPADHAIRRRRELTEVLRDAATLAAERPGCLVTIGVPPTGPETAYGYIHCGEELGVRGLTRFYHSLGFREKPDPERARAFVAAGCYRWNSGMFIWQVRSLREAFRRYAPELGELFDDVRTLIREGRLENGLAERFLRSDRISIDYAVMEKADDVAVAECRFDWDDVGSWTALRNHLPVDGDGNVAEGLFAGIDARNLTVMGSADHLIAAIGVEDLVIVNTGDVTLVCRASEAQRIKELLKLADTRPELRKFL